MSFKSWKTPAAQDCPKSPPGRPAAHTIAPVALPEFVPLPRARGVEFYSGLKRGSLNQLVLPCEKNGYRPPVKSISLKKPGNSKGTRLIVLSSLLAYLRGLQKAQAGQGNCEELDAREAQPA